MTAARTSEPRKSRKAVTHGGERVAVTRFADLLKTVRIGKARSAIHVVDETGRQVALPGPLVDVMARAASLMAEGRQVSVIADDEMLTTQGAAERLNVSRQYVVRLVDRGSLPAVKVGSHRRLRASDVEAFRVQRDVERNTALDRLASMSEEMGGYRLVR
ncbi:MAG TPA: helix-turn-helix domain-containing protein [Allosphingosinicella sp.]|nr:helix-turn-helix domain-containing protein [Allosphingosinicella sp.]